MDDLKDFDVVDNEPLIDPRLFGKEHWNAIRQLTQLIMKRDNVPYFQAAVFAYVEWLELAHMNDTRH